MSRDSTSPRQQQHRGRAEARIANHRKELKLTKEKVRTGRRFRGAIMPTASHPEIRRVRREGKYLGADILRDGDQLLRHPAPSCKKRASITIPSWDGHVSRARTADVRPPRGGFGARRAA